ncbi:hypothetical protein B0T19DRAFT_204394 [Cercophora scortea]|uniref:Uncharacterized protein n=1 Tax=Cercophora scortea TaxID=314031 RepID=A0AAE0IE44_9PEZI|nr:hypothetical protein B0T19DRAFT_204394 [Cercophora scortea]
MLLPPAPSPRYRITTAVPAHPNLAVAPRLANLRNLQIAFCINPHITTWLLYPNSSLYFNYCPNATVAGPSTTVSQPDTTQDSRTHAFPDVLSLGIGLSRYSGKGKALARHSKATKHTYDSHGQPHRRTSQRALAGGDPSHLGLDNTVPLLLGAGAPIAGRPGPPAERCQPGARGSRREDTTNVPAGGEADGAVELAEEWREYRRYDGEDPGWADRDCAYPFPSPLPPYLFSCYALQTRLI